MIIRERVGSDLEECVALITRVHHVDGYPVWLGGTAERFIAGSGSLGAWVAIGEGNVVGHVALNRSVADVVMSTATGATGLPADRHGVVARLFTSPDVRRRGVGRLLLETAADAARGRGLVPILDVTAGHAAAVALYEAMGWRRVGLVAVPIPGEAPREMFVYVGPD